MTDFTGTDLSGIYNPYMSQYNLDYLSQILEAQGYTLDQIAGMSQDQINSLVSTLVQSNTGSAPDPGVLNGGGGAPPRPAPVMDTSGLPMGYARDPATGQAITEQQWRSKYGGQGLPPPPPPAAQQGGMDQQSAQNLANAAAGGAYRQDSSGQWYNAETGEKWDPSQGMPQDIANAYMLGSIPGGLENAMSGGPQPYSDYLDFKDPTTGEARPVPAAIQSLAADPNTDVIAMEDGYYLTDPVHGTSSKYAPDGSVIYETKVDAGGNYVTSYANGAKTLVTKNGWRTDYDNTGKVLTHKYQGDPRPDWKNLAKSGDPRTRQAAIEGMKNEYMGPMQNALGSAMGPDGRPRMPENQRPHTLPPGGSPGSPATPGYNAHSQFGSLGYSGPVPGHPATPASNGVPQNPALGSIDPNDPTVWKHYTDENGIVQTKFEPNPNDPRFDLTDKAQTAYNNSPEGRAAFQQREMDAQAERSSRAGDLQASGETEWSLKHQASIPPDDTPGYGSNPPSGPTPPGAGTVGSGPTPPTSQVPPPPPGTTQPPAIQPPSVMPPGDVRAMPYPGRPTPPGSPPVSAPGYPDPYGPPSATSPGSYQWPTKTPPPGYVSPQPPAPGPRPVPPQWQHPYPWEVGKTPPPGYPSAWLNPPPAPPAVAPPVDSPYGHPMPPTRPPGDYRMMPGGTRPTSYPTTQGQGITSARVDGILGHPGGSLVPPPAGADQFSFGAITQPAAPAPITPPVQTPAVQPPQLSMTNPTSPGWSTGSDAFRLPSLDPTKLAIQPPLKYPGNGWRG